MFNETYIPKVPAVYQRWVSDTYDSESGVNVPTYISTQIQVYITEVKQRGVPVTYVTTAITSDDVGFPGVNDKLVVSGYRGVTATYAVITSQLDAVGALTSLTLQREGVV